jgi:hypothetical protein
MAIASDSASQQWRSVSPEPQQLTLAPCAATASARPRSAAKMLPRFDPGVMETYLDDMREMKLRVYELFRQHPDLLPNVEEGLSKGGVRRMYKSAGYRKPAR